MWYDRSGARVIFYAGVMFLMVGYGLYLMGHRTPGIILMVIGIFAMMIGFTMIAMHIMVDFNKK